MALFLDLEYVLSIVSSPLYSMEITYCVWSGLYHLLVEMLILIGLGVCIIFIFLGLVLYIIVGREVIIMAIWTSVQYMLRPVARCSRGCSRWP